MNSLRNVREDVWEFVVGRGGEEFIGKVKFSQGTLPIYVEYPRSIVRGRGGVRVARQDYKSLVYSGYDLSHAG